MSQCIFKRLFEVRLLHDYFLNTENESFFAGTLSNAQREERLRELASMGQLNMRKEIEIRPTEKTKQHLRNYRLRFIPTLTGFFVGVQVKKIEPGDGSVTYQPLIPISDELEFSFHIYPLNPRFISYSNIPLRKRIEAIYHFDNRMSTGKVAPALSLPVLPFDPDASYEMGEMIIYNNLLQGIVEGYVPPQQPILPQPDSESVDGTGLINTNDRRLLPKKFFLKIPGTESITTVRVDLIDNGGNTVNQRNFDTNGDVKLLSVDLLKDDNGNPVEIADDVYTLNVTENQDLTLSKQVLFNEDLCDRNAFAALTLDTGETDAGFKILETDGSLVTKVDSSGNVTPSPVFELRMTSRRCFWRYKSVDTSNFPFVDGINVVGSLSQPLGTNNILITNFPLSLTRIPVQVGLLNLPNPLENAPLRYESRRYYTDVYVSPVNKLVDA